MPYADSADRSAANKRHYERHRKQYAEKRERQRDKCRRFVRRLKSLGHCADCGGRFHPTAMDFHHTDPSTKAGHVATLVNSGAFQRLKAEIRKCILLCANCHRVREHAASHNPHGTHRVSCALRPCPT